MNKTVEDALNELIEFYSITDINDLQYLKKLFVRNLKDVRRRWIKYDKPIREENKQLKDNWNKLKEYIDIKLYNTEYLQKICNCRIDDTNHILLDAIRERMLELEQGSDSNE